VASAAGQGDDGAAVVPSLDRLDDAGKHRRYARFVALGEYAAVDVGTLFHLRVVERHEGAKAVAEWQADGFAACFARACRQSGLAQRGLHGVGDEPVGIAHRPIEI